MKLFSLGLGVITAFWAGFAQADWDVVGDANWSEEDGVIQASAGNGFLVTKVPYKDFSIKLEFYPESDSNSGVFFRCGDPAVINDKTCYEVNIFDKRPEPSGRTGAIVNVAPPRVMLNTEGKWNTYEITANEKHLVVKLNGQITVDTYDDKLKDGLLALQFAKGGIKFRNVKITRLRKGIDISGLWELRSFELDDGRGNIQPWCEGAYGTVMYFQDHMSVAINCHTNPSKMVLYSGPYAVEGAVVTHFAKNFSSPDLKKDFRRNIEMPNPNTLNLVGPFGDGGKAVVSWQRRP